MMTGFGISEQEVLSWRGIVSQGIDHRAHVQIDTRLVQRSHTLTQL
jgi:hypothetical protein